MGACQDPTVAHPRLPAAQRRLGGRGPREDPGPPSSDRRRRAVAMRWLAPDAATAGVPRLGRQIACPQTAVSLLLAVAVVYLVAQRGFGLEWPTIWARLQATQAGLLLLALAVFYGSFVFRTLR